LQSRSEKSIPRTKRHCRIHFQLGTKFTPIFCSQGEDDAFRKFKLKCEEVSGMNVLTNFYGMDLTTDKLRSLVRKWHTLIEAHTDIKTTDGYTLRLFCIGFTKRRMGQNKKTSYAQSAQVRNIRRKMVEIMNREATSVDLSQLVQTKLISEVIGREITKATEVTLSYHHLSSPSSPPAPLPRLLLLNRPTLSLVARPPITS
jgi:uncharacterized protein YejL (UPF0352 family)